MVDLRAKPFYLNDAQIDWVEKTISSMSVEEKIGQLFITLLASADDRKPENISKLLEKYHVGGVRYHNAPPADIRDMAECLQKTSRIPLLIASNCEAGGNGGMTGGTAVACGAALSAIGKEESVYKMAKVCAAEADAVGCNWNFAPIVDLPYNWRNTIVNLRAYNEDPNDVIRFAKSFFKAMREFGIATCIKHFPGDGTEENDQHLIMGVNDLSPEEWDKTFGKVYKALIDEGVMTIMAGHIALPKYSKKLDPSLKDEDIRPATLAPELIQKLLREKLGYNGLVVTDASHMIGMFGATVPRSQQVPSAIAAGCDMFLFFNDKDEDFQYMMDGYKKGIISEERLSDALHRIIGLKAAIGLPKKQRAGSLVPSEKNLSVVGCAEHKKIARDLAAEFVTLVKDRDHYLPMTPEKYKNIKLIYIGADDMVIAGTKLPSNNEDVIKNIVKALESRGFAVDFEPMKVKGKCEEFKKKYDAVLLVLNVSGFAQFNTMRVKWDMPAKQPWYFSEVPTFAVSLSFTNMLIDVPMARCYINSYMSHSEAIEATVDKMTGKAPFTGKFRENVFCGRWDTRF
ncbi:glycoside hydrolase family 3 protein [Treponema parvum]|uniref:beta-N-acetylhexosaminidase n=1 Tax=Treponema parvum TaxID=138851 RepID=A0A975F151_9SPIR|nr:glycoside hydrolase family 3 N-terminal domain-containing protein [Treponema parvum]QTQ12174.1 glycoside hydrolase family 3 protein [Treponema parvum]